uniref:Uncharacterized protein n=1 Tax=Cacopsylla melanoneura TaxID=428564 RepID=A0A8D9BUR3_9HEMI
MSISDKFENVFISLSHIFSYLSFIFLTISLLREQHGNSPVKIVSTNQTVEMSAELLLLLSCMVSVLVWIVKEWYRSPPPTTTVPHSRQPRRPRNHQSQGRPRNHQSLKK